MKAKELSGFCMQMSLLLDSGIPLESGLEVMAEDVDKEEEKKLLLEMASDVELGTMLDSSMEKTGEFPDYLIKMAGIGHKTGNLEKVMKSMSDYYDKEYHISRTIKNAVSYPMMMITMLMVVMFVLLTQVMPIFEQVYRQLGTELSAVTKQAVKLGTIFSGGAIVFVAVMALLALIVSLRKPKAGSVTWAEKLMELMKEKSRLADAVVKRRVLAVMAISESSGLKPEEGIAFVKGMVPDKYKGLMEECSEKMELGSNVYDALRETGLFSGMDMQMIKVGNRTGKAEVIFNELSNKYENQIDEAIDNFIGRFEPTIVIALALIVGLILMSVMMPLIGIMASMGL